MSWLLLSIAKCALFDTRCRCEREEGEREGGREGGREREKEREGGGNARHFNYFLYEQYQMYSVNIIILDMYNNYNYVTGSSKMQHMHTTILPPSILAILMTVLQSAVAH